MMKFLPSTLLSLLHLALPALSHASPQPALVSTDWEISLIPHHTLFLRQLSNLQTFESALGGTKASAITNSGDPQRPYSVDGNTFTDFQSAGQRSCNAQFNGCADDANKHGGGDKGGDLTVQQCEQQQTQCNSAQQSAPVQDFQSGVPSTNIGPDPQFPDYDLICEG